MAQNSELDIFNGNGEHFAFASYLSIELNNSDFHITAGGFLDVFYLERGEGTVYLAESGRNKKATTLKRGEIFICRNSFGQISFKGKARLLAVSPSTIENYQSQKSKSESQSFSLGHGDDLSPTPKITNMPIGDFFGNVKHVFTELAENSFLQFYSTPYLTATIKRVIEHINSNRADNFHSLTSQLLIFNMLEEISECVAGLKLGHHHVDRILEYINLHFASQITLEDIANGVSLNVSYMQKIFKEKIGFTVYEYLTTHRINQAIALMKNTNLPLVDICVEVGFQNRQTFHSAFKRYMGYSPSLFRKFLTEPVAEAKFI